MYEGNKAKFEQNPQFIKQLCSTKGDIVFTASSRFWCQWNSLIMKRLRSEFRQNGKEDEEIVERITKKMKEYEEEN
jgi:hypothetical protein